VYGGLHFSESEILSWSRERREWYVERLKKQMEAEKEHVKSARKRR
jgi:hypothetical protein